MTPESTRLIRFRVQRYNPAQDSAPRWDEHDLPVTDGMTVLEALHALKAGPDPTLAWRSSCRMGICGSCGMFINGLPRLACQTQVLHLEAATVEVSPLPNYPIVKDLVPDLHPLFDKHGATRPYLMVAGQPANGAPIGGEFLQTPAQRDAYAQFTICITCGLCLAACPTAATDPDFLGPQALAQAFRYCHDSRDVGLTARLDVLDAAHGPFQCHLAGACTEACPKGVDPALGIQLLKRSLVLQAVGLGGARRAPHVAQLADQVVPNDKIPQPPARTAQPGEDT